MNDSFREGGTVERQVRDIAIHYWTLAKNQLKNEDDRSDQD